MRTPTQRPRGLILLIVLGMLTLFSLLAISYIVVSGQSRTANFGMARQDFHGTAAPKLLDEAARQLLRGSLDHNSIMWRQGLLGDLYGSGNLDNAGLPLPISDGSVVRFARTPATVNTPNAPAIFKQTFLKIPLANTAPSLPVHHDVWNGRIVTFGGGPLSGESFRIVRYCGDMQGGSANAFDQALEYSIVIDLTHVKSRIITVGTTSQSVDQWIASSSTSNGAILCYDSVANALQSPYPLLINGAPLNASGSGLGVDGVWAAATPTPPTPQLAQSAPTIAALAHAPPALSQYPTGFGNFPTAFLQNFAYTQRANVAFQPAGDLDEPYDAADYNDFHVAFRHSGAASGADIIPSFHRPSVINFIYEQIKLSKGGSIASFTPQELFATIDLLQRASGRPLSFRVQNVPTQYRLPPPPNSTNRYPHIEQNPQFTGGNFPAFSPLPIRTPQLDIDWQAWASDTQQQVKFENWVNWLREGPWDVDADSDGLEDSNWVDLNFPLMTSPEGKLLKLLTAYYVEDLGGRLNINTSGNLAQANRSTNTFSGDTSRFVDALALPQGPGYGTAEISLRHLFTSDLAYIRFLAERYGATVQTPPAQLVNFRPGTNGNDPASILRERHRRPQYNPLSLPGLPTSVFGEVGLTLDLFGNPIRYQVAEPDQNLDDPYEARLLNGESHHDLPITLAEWERLARQQDWDRSSMPQRLERLMGAVTPDVMRGITPRSNSTLAPMFSGTYLTGATLPAPPVRRVGSFLELVEALAQQRFSASSIYFTNQQLKMLFPVEFSHNIKLDLNRPLGNGLDDNSNGLVDEPEEVGAGQLAEYVSAPLPAISDQYDRDKDREGDTGGLFDPYAAIPNYFIPAVNGSRGRQLLARHLYCLAQLILPDDYVLPNQEPTTYSGLTTLAKREVRARVLAQWAVNVVDFRDADITMTRFPYDPDPFGVTNSNVAKWQPDTNHVVWGCEPTDLLLTETLAFHDTRISKNVATMQPGSTREFEDEVWKQIRVPEGSLFLELLYPRSSDPNTAAIANSTTLAPTRSNYWLNGQLNLSAITPLGIGPERFPVWRVLLLRPQANASTPTTPLESYVDPSQRAFQQYQFSQEAGLVWGFDPSNPSTPVNAPQVDRVVWFSNLTANPQNIASPTGSTLDPNHVYRFKGANPLTLQPGQYLCAGPRETTILGLQQPRETRDPPIVVPDNQLPTAADTYPAVYAPSEQQISLNTGGAFVGTGVTVSIFDGGAAVAPTARTAIIESQEDVQDGGAPWATPRASGLNISEPTPEAYYTEPTINISGTFPIDDGYVDRSTDAFANSSTDPEDLTKGLLSTGGWEMLDSSGSPIRPKFASRTNWSTAVLQRLANPDLPWEAAINPYVTVDWLPIDLTVFSGETYGEGNLISAIDEPDPLTVDDPFTAENEITPADDPATPNIDESIRTFRFNSRQKSGTSVSPTEPIQYNTNPNVIMQGGRTHYSYHTESAFRNEPRSGAVARTIPTNFEFELSVQTNNLAARLSGQQHFAEWMTLGDLNSRFGLRGPTSDGGALHAMYPRAAVYLDTNGTLQPPTAPYWANRDFVSAHELMNVPLSSPGQFLQDFTPVAPTANNSFPFHHLLDFDALSGPNSSLPFKPAAALLDLVNTRDPWVDSEQILPPNATFDPGASSGSLANSALDIYRPPFNRISTYVEQGRVNLNTASEAGVLHGLLSNMMPVADRASFNNIPYQADILTSRKGSAATPRLANDSPSQFAGVFKSSFAAMNAPSMPSPVPPLQRDNSAQTGLMRPSFVTPTARLFNPTPISGNSPHYNPLPLNYPVSRLTNLTTTNSNVYAVRVVIGYFEYDPLTGLGPEYGEDRGTARRHRAFYVIDRSIPVAYQEGQDHNTDKCILVRRIIE